MHEISEVLMPDGRTVTEAMYANEPAWHHLGKVFDPLGKQAPDSETMIQGSHLDWQVEKEAIQLVNRGTEELPSCDIADHFSLVRQDTRQTLGIVGTKYEVLQNREAFAFLDSLLMDGIMRYESAFALQGGRGVVLLARMPSVDWVTKEDPQLRYVLCNLSHGFGSIALMPTEVRAVCANTLRMALSNGTYKVTIRHSGDMSDKLAEAKVYLSQFDKLFTDYTERAKELLVGVSKAQAKDYIGELFPVRDDTARMEKADLKKVQQVRDTFLHPRDRNGRLKTIKDTWWELFNGVTETIDHADKAQQAKNLLKRRENRFMSGSDGPDAVFKNRAFELALEMAS